jgi:hypothetical protein
VTKRGKRISLIVVGAVVVVVVAALALFTREQPPYEFLRGAERYMTIVHINGDYAETWYVSNGTVRQVTDAATEELKPMGWQCAETDFYVLGRLTRDIHVFVSGRHNEARLRGKTIVSVVLPVTPRDRFNAWLDRVTGR